MSMTFYVDAEGFAIFDDTVIPQDVRNRDWRKLQAAIAAGEVSEVAAPAPPVNPNAVPKVDAQLDEIWELVNPPPNSDAHAMREKMRGRSGRS